MYANVKKNNTMFHVVYCYRITVGGSQIKTKNVQNLNYESVTLNYEINWYPKFYTPRFSSNYSCQPIILIYRRCNLIYHYWGYMSIYLRCPIPLDPWGKSPSPSHPHEVAQITKSWKIIVFKSTNQIGDIFCITSWITR